MNARLILLSIFPLLSLNAADTAELSEFAMQELIENKNLMLHIDSNALARACMFVCKQWHDNIVAYRTSAVDVFNKEHQIDQIDQKKKIILIKQDGSTVNIFTNSVIIDASGNFGTGASDEVGGVRYVFELVSKTYVIRKSGLCFLDSDNVKVTKAIGNSMRTLCICKSEKNQSTGHAEVAWIELHRKMWNKLHYNNPVSVSLYLANDGNPAYRTYRKLDTICFKSDGTKIITSNKSESRISNWRRNYDDKKKEIEDKKAAEKKETEEAEVVADTEEATISSKPSTKSKVKKFFSKFQ